MKGSILFIAIFALGLLLIPMVAIGFEGAAPPADVPVHSPAVPQGGEQPAQQQPVQSLPQQSEAEPALLDSPFDEPVDEVFEETPPTESQPLSENGVSSFRILDESTGQVVTVSARDFVRGAVAAEMPVSFHAEALKAQAVAAHTYALHNHRIQQENPDPALQGADFSADPSNMLVYITEETAKAFYGDNADLHWEKICQAADSVLDYVLEYDDEPIVAAYHAISAGQTEDAANVWMGEAPYLLAADSSGDLLAPDYETGVTLSRSTVQNALETVYPAANLPDDPAGWFAEITRSDSGYITSVDVGGVELHGKDIRTLFDLRSHNIDIEYIPDNETFNFIVYGYGHGVGLSQYGADFMARQGATFDEILENYYTGATLKLLDTGE